MKALQWLSERMDLLPTETRMRLDNERVKVEIAKEKLELEKGKANKETLDNELKIVIDYGDENGNS